MNIIDAQNKLIELGYLAPGEADGRFGSKSLDAFNHFRATLGLEPVAQTSMTELTTLLFPVSVKPKLPGLFSQIGGILSLINLLKGKTMTTDQIGGIVRTLLAVALSYLAGKGYIPNVQPELLATITAAIVGVWSWWTNRAEKIVGK